MHLALNNLQRLIRHKPQRNKKKKTNQFAKIFPAEN